MNNLNIGILTCEGFDEYKKFDQEIIVELNKRNIQAEQVVWTNPNVDWSKYNIILVRSTWDYFQNNEKLNNFISTLDKIKKLGIPIFNSYDTIKWNCKKTYLKELEQKGIPVIDTLWVPKSQLTSIADLIKAKGWDHCVIKPVISGGGLHTKEFFSDKANEVAEKCLKLAVEEWMVQPFAEEIVQEGERSFIYIGKEYCHCVLKKPATGNFLASPTHGASIHVDYPDPQMIDQAKKILEASNQDSLYARIDAIYRNSQLIVVEIEMIEPYLFHESSEHFTERFTDLLLEKGLNSQAPNGK